MAMRSMVKQLILAGTALALAGGCQTAPVKRDVLVLFPPPPEAPRVQFLTWASGAKELEPEKSGLEQFILGDEPGRQRGIDKPYGVAARNGVVYVCDSKGLAISRLDFKNQTYSVLGVRGPGRLRKPINLVVDSLGYLFVVDPVRMQVVVFGPDEKFVRAFDIPKPCRPVDVAISGNELFVLDNDDTPQIVVLERTTGEVLRTFGEAGGEPGQFKMPGSIAVSPDGYLYVSDTHNWRIQKLTLQGEPVWVKGTPGYRLGQFGRPRGIRVAPDGIVYVVDGATELVQMFDGDGNVLMRFGGPGNAPGTLGLPATLAIDTTSLPYFQKYLHKDFRPEYLMFVTSQYGSHLVNAYAFGSFPKGYTFSDQEIASIPPVPIEKGIGPVEGREVPPPAGKTGHDPPDNEPG